MADRLKAIIGIERSAAGIFHGIAWNRKTNMALVDLQVPGLEESVSEATIAKWVKADGDYVGQDDVVAELETDKATVELPAGKSGTLKIVAQKGQTVNVGDVIAKIDPAGTKAAASAAAPAAPAKGSAGTPTGGA